MVTKGFIQNKSLGLVMGIKNNDRTPGSRMCTWTKDDNWDKVWSIDEEGYITNVNTGLVMGISDNSKCKGASIATWTKDGNWDKKWSFTSEGHIRNRETGLVMGISHSSEKPGAQIATWSKDGNWDKVWQFVPVVDQVSERLQASEQQVQKMQADLATWQQKVQTLEQQVLKLKADVTTEQLKVQASDQQVQRLKGDLVTEQRKLQDSIQQVHKLSADLAVVQHKVQFYDHEVQKLTAGWVAEQQKVQASEKQVQQLKADLAIEQRAVQASHQQVQKLEADLTNRVTMESDIKVAVLEERCRQYEERLQQSEKEGVRLRGELSDMSYRLLSRVDIDSPSLVRCDSKPESGSGSWVCISQSCAAAEGPCDEGDEVGSFISVGTSLTQCFMKDAVFKTVCGDSEFFLPAERLQKGSRVVAEDGKTIVEVVAVPELLETDKIVDLCAGSATLSVTPDHRIPMMKEIGGQRCDAHAETLKQGDIVFVDGLATPLTSISIKTLADEVQVLKIAFKPDLPVGVFSCPSMISSKGSRKKSLRRSMKHRGQTEAAEYQTIGEYKD